MTDQKDEAQETLASDIGSTLRGLWKHYKWGLYIVFSESVEEATGTLLVHYYSIEKRTRWTRTVNNFSQVVGIEGTRRFTLIRPALDEELHLAAFDND